MASHRDPSMVETEIRRGPRHRVFRTCDPREGALLVKRGMDDDPGGLSRSALHNEHRILERLQGLAGCPRVVRFDPLARELAVEDFGGLPLSQSDCPGRLGLEGFLTVAERLAVIVADIHGRGVVHKDVNPSTILIRPDDLQVQITDFELAATFAEEYPEFAHPSRLVGTPAYVSPEQTGRMNRPVDYRTDLYSLGATLYTLATGVPPFDATDTLGLIHAHLARFPCPPQERAPWLPPRVAEVILLLLAKEPDDRYQSAAGLAHDLHRLRMALAEGGSQDAIRLREQDLSLSPRPPRRLYGRDTELAALLEVFVQVSGGGARGLFVAGYSGVGKTSLIHEIYRPVTLGHGLFISGKFEQFQRDRPFLAPAMSLRQLCQLLLAEPEAAVVRWRDRIVAATGADAGALFEVVPELEALLGPQGPVAELGPREALVRLRTLLVALVRQVASPAHPLVLFLDDLQWADQPSVDFIGALLEETALDGLLLIGAFRDNEVDATHPLMRLLRQPTVARAAGPVLTLSNLAVGDVANLLADMLRVPPGAVESLAQALHARTSGNPFFTVEFLTALHRGGVLRPEPERGMWTWDTAAILALPASTNVVDFLAAGLAELAHATTEELVSAACLGNACSLGILELATGTDCGTLAHRLAPALERGIIVTSSAVAFHEAEPDVQFRFCHDGMQQAVYQSADEAWRGRLHLAMARRFAGAGGESDHPFDAAEHYAAATSLVVDPAERAVARRLFLAAAVRARQSGSFETSERFLRLGLLLLPADAWQRDAEAAFVLHAELHLALYSQSRSAEADEVYALVAAHADAPLRLVDSACVQIVSLSQRTRYSDALDLGCSLLAQLGMAVPLGDLTGSLEQELALFYRHVDDGALETMQNCPPLADDRLLGAARLMNRAGTTAYFCQPALSRWLQVRLARLWIENGFCAAMVCPTSYLICATIAQRGDYATGYRIGCTALEAGLARERGIETARAQHVFGLFNSHWFRPLEESLVHTRIAFDGLSRAGSLDFACYTFRASQVAVLETCSHLAEMEAEVSMAIGFCRKTDNRHAEQSYVTLRQLVRALKGETTGAGGFDDAEFDEQVHLVAAVDNTYAQCFLHIFRALSACLFGDDVTMVRHADAAVRLTPGIPGVYPTALANLLQSLALIERIRRAPGSEISALRERLATNQEWLAARAADAPVNFGHLHDLVEAERMDSLGRIQDALERFEVAMRNAQGHQRPWHHALITERAGHCYMRCGLEHAGRSLLTRAHALYRNWGAEGKAQAMRAALPFVVAGRGDERGDGHGDAVDYEVLQRASQALASERSLPRLVVQVVQLVVHLTGATDARLILLDDEGTWHLEGGVRGEETLQRMPVDEAEKRGIVAGAALRLALKTCEPVVSDDAVIDSRFAGDPHFAGLQLCSLLALPVLVQGRVTAFVALENRLLRAAFTPARVESITTLCAQLAISIENVRLYRSLEFKVAERTRELSEQVNEVRRATEHIKILQGILPICMYCKKIRNDQGYWDQVEAYVTRHSEAQFSHGICPSCLDEHYPGFSAGRWNEDSPSG